MNNSKKIVSLKIAMAAALLASCQTSPTKPDGELLTVNVKEMAREEGGVVILEGVPIGDTSAYTSAQDDSDCIMGSGYGVKVQSATGDRRFLFDRNGKPCEAAETLYDGTVSAYTRAADPSIDIAFVDKYGDRPSEMVELVPSLAHDDDFAGELNLTGSELPEDFALVGQGVDLNEAKRSLKEEAPLQGGSDGFTNKIASVTDKNMQQDAWDYQKEITKLPPTEKQEELAETIQEWHQEYERKKLVNQAEKMLAGARSLERKSSHDLIAEHQEELGRLMTRLRESEKLFEQQRFREQILQGRLLELQAALDAKETVQTQTAQKLTQDAQVSAQRAREYKQIAHELKQQKLATEKTLRHRISDLRKQLALAEKSAENNHHKLLLDAAEQLALAEENTRQVHKAKREKYERQAEKKRLEASYLEDKASALANIDPVVLPEFTQIAFMEDPNTKLEQRILKLENRLKALQVAPSEEMSLHERLFTGVQLALNAEDQTLDDIMRQALSQAMPHAQWELEWKLSDVNASIKNEKWTVVAEARMDEFLAYVKEKVKQAHNADLLFHRFEEGGLFVISDMPIQ